MFRNTFAKGTIDFLGQLHRLQMVSNNYTIVNSVQLEYSEFRVT